MIKKLTINDIVEIIQKTPEQCLFDWKSDLKFINTSEKKKSEIVKDIVAIANATTTGPGFIFFGVHPEHPNIIKGITERNDDSNFQQLVEGKVEPNIDFVYYEVNYGNLDVGVIHVEPSLKRPHIITKNYGILRKGQILIRRGSSTDGIKREELFECFYGQTSPYFQNILRNEGIKSYELQALSNYLEQSRKHEKNIKNDILNTLGLE